MEMQFGNHSYQEQAYNFIKYYCTDKSPDFVIKTVMSVLKDVEEVINKILDAAVETGTVEQTVLF